MISTWFCFVSTEWHREVAIITGVILTGLAVIATILAVAFACFKQRSPTRSRGQRRQSRTHLLHNRASSTSGNDSPTLLKPLQTIYEDSPPNSPDIVPVRQPGGQQSDTNTEETEPACERVQPQRDGADLWQNSLPPAYHAWYTSRRRVYVCTVMQLLELMFFR